MLEPVRSPHRIEVIVRWLKKRVEHDEGEKWREWLGDRARNPLWLPGKRGVWGYRREANGEHAFSVSDVLPSPEASDDLWWWYIFHPDAGLGGSLMMSPAPDNSTDITPDGCTDQWLPYFRMLLEEMTRPNLAVAVGGELRRRAEDPSEPDAKRDATQRGTGKRRVPETPRVPTYQANYRRWFRTWTLIQGQAKKGTPVKDLSAWLQRTHPEVSHSVGTLAAIIRAGEAGLLILGKALR